MKRLSNAGRFTRLLAIGFGGMALAALPACDRTPARTVLSVNGLAVPPEEFLWFMDQERGRVISAMLAKKGDKFDAGFWNRKAGNETPKEMLYQRTIDRVKREKVEQLLFVELGLIRNASFTSFQAEMERTNRERAADKARGKAVYGPVAYSMLQYFGLWKSGLQIKAKEILKHDRLAVSDEELRTSYQQNARLYTSPPVSSWEFVSLTPVSNTGGPQSLEQFDAALKKLSSRLQSGATAQQIKDEWPQTREFEITAERHTDIDAERLAETIGDGDRFATLLAMQPGRAAILSAGANPPQIVKCTSRKPGALQPFEKVVAQIRNRLLQERYDAFVAERAAIADARVDPAELELLPLSIGK